MPAAHLAAIRTHRNSPATDPRHRDGQRRRLVDILADVVVGGELRQQVEALDDEADAPVADVRETVDRQPGDLLAAQAVGAVGGAVGEAALLCSSGARDLTVEGSEATGRHVGDQETCSGTSTRPSGRTRAARSRSIAPCQAVGPTLPLAEAVRAVVAALEKAYGSKDLGNRADPIEELAFIPLTRQTHRQNSLRSWAAIEAIGGPQALLEIPEEELGTLLKDGGFSRQKARWIKRSLELIVERFGRLSLAEAESWSDAEVEAFLCTLPGIKVKSARCVMMYSMGPDVVLVEAPDPAGGQCPAEQRLLVGRPVEALFARLLGTDPDLLGALEQGQGGDVPGPGRKALEEERHRPRSHVGYRWVPRSHVLTLPRHLAALEPGPIAARELCR